MAPKSHGFWGHFFERFAIIYRKIYYNKDILCPISRIFCFVWSCKMLVSFFFGAASSYNGT